MVMYLICLAFFCHVTLQSQNPLTYTPLPLSGVVKLLPQHQEVNDIRHVMVSAKRHMYKLSQELLQKE